MLCTWFCARRLADSGIMNSLALPSLQGRQAGRQAAPGQGWDSSARLQRPPGHLQCTALCCTCTVFC